MMYSWTILFAIVAVASANLDPQMDQQLDEQDEKLDRLVARMQRAIDTIERRKKERADADREAKNMLLRLNKLDNSGEVDKCPSKHFKCVVGGDRTGKRCVANILVCDGANDCMDGSDEDPNLCTGSHSDWSYEGDTGPDHWGDHFPICNKRRQSPINIRSEGVTYKDLGQITFVRYHKPGLGMKLKNNGHTAQVDITDGSAYIKKSDLVGRRFKLAQFHFHWGKDSSQGSEHTHDNKAYPAEMHLVHFNTKYESLSEAADKRNGLAVLGVFIEVGQTDNKGFSDIINNLQNVKQPDTETDIPSIQLDKLLPINTDDYFRYRGSLTTPPCYQSVQWTVFKQPVYLSEIQLSEFRKLMDSKGKKLVDNFRPVQPLRVRAVFSDYSRP